MAPGPASSTQPVPRWRSRCTRDSAGSSASAAFAWREGCSGRRCRSASSTRAPSRCCSTPRSSSEVAMEDCIFCKIVAGKIPAKKVGESEGAIAFPDINPCMPVHVLVVPKKHVASLNEAGDGSVMAPVFALAEKVARDHGLDKTGWRAGVKAGAGHTASLVGGWVRHRLLRIRPKAFDVAPSAHPNQARAPFRNSRLIGRRFRLAHVFSRGGKISEVSPFRANPLDELQDLPQDLLIRHDNVFGSAEEDARRRDFTINGLFYDVDDGRVIDYVGGKDDLRARLIRTIGNPDVRMREDPVRILRAIRFAAKCAFELEPNTLSAMRAHVHEIPRCAPPRVLEEVLKLIRSGASRRSFELLREVGALRILLPPVAAYLERRGPEEAERHLRALDALDEHVRAGEIPSDAVLLARPLAPLPRDAAPRGPLPQASKPQPPLAAGKADAELH